MNVVYGLFKAGKNTHKRKPSATARASMEGRWDGQGMRHETHCKAGTFLGDTGDGRGRRRNCLPSASLASLLPILTFFFLHVSLCLLLSKICPPSPCLPLRKRTKTAPYREGRQAGKAGQASPIPTHSPFGRRDSSSFSISPFHIHTPWQCRHWHTLYLS